MYKITWLARVATAAISAPSITWCGVCSSRIAVFKRARLVFIGIAHHIAVAVFALGIHRRFPFAPSGKAGAAHAAQTGFLQSGHNVLGFP